MKNDTKLYHIKKIRELIDTQWVKLNPQLMLDLLDELIKQRDFDKDYIQSLHKKLMLASALLEDMKEEQK